MRNLEQIRAANAFKAAPGIGKGKKDGKGVAKKVPTYVRNNGILGAAAFALETKGGYEDVLQAIIEHLRHPEIALTAASDLESFIAQVSEVESVALRMITDEAMAYLNYLRRFAD